MQRPPSSSDEALREQRALITLSLIPGVGPGRIRNLIAHIGSASEVLEVSATTLSGVPGIGQQTAESIAGFEDYEQVGDQIGLAQQVGAWLLPVWAPIFPPLLRQIYDPPVFLWVRGSLQTIDERAVAIVGTRRASRYGTEVAYRFAQALARNGFTIVSGLAYGIDTAAHEGALDAGGRTLAVLGTGVDLVYPRANAGLARRIEAQGALLSEYALLTKPEAVNFPRRNRIISGLALGTLIAEAHAEGGALLTARLALEQNREVFAVPCALYTSSGTGNHQLIQDGHAKLVTDVADILNEFQGVVRLAPSPQSPEPPPPPDLNRVELQLWKALGPEPIPIDTLCLQTGLDTATALVYLLNLEFRGLIRQLAGKQFVRI